MFHSHEVISHPCVSGDSQDQNIEDVQIEPSCESLLTVLDDKNRLIATLKKQLENQKLQLDYYLKKQLSSTKLAKISKSCSPDALEESISINLAMTHFNKQTGKKSNISSLYDRMCYIDERISSTLEDQEFILRKIVNKLCEFVKHANGNIEFRLQFSNFITEPFHVELFSKLLNATINLKKKLDTFRICCNRLMIIEDERNAIVEQIYTLPAEQRMNCNYLVGIQSEKLQLENELEQIIKDHRKDQERIKDLNVIEEKLSNLQYQLNSAMFKTDDGYQISRMLQDVNSEARILLELTKQQRKKFEVKLAHIKETNLTLERILVYLKLALSDKKFVRSELLEYDITTKQDFKIFGCIRKAINTWKNKFKCKLFDELQMKQKEIELLHTRFNQVATEKEELKISNRQLKRNISDMKFNQELDLVALREERDMYKNQVSDLEAIREAYAQLVHKQPTKTKLEQEYLDQIKERDDQIYELEKVNRDLITELKALNITINKQNRDIKQKTKIIEEMKPPSSRNLNEYEDKNLKYVYKNTNSERYGSYKDIRAHDTISYVELYQEEIYVEEKVINWVDDGGDQALDSMNKPAPFISKRLDNLHCVESTDKRESKRSISCFKVISSSRAQTNEVMEAIVETDLIERDSLRNKKNNSPAFCKETNCKTISQSLNTLENKDVDEYELMKDCSEESMPSVCHSKRKSFQQRFSIINDQIEY